MKKSYQFLFVALALAAIVNCKGEKRGDVKAVSPTSEDRGGRFEPRRGSVRLEEISSHEDYQYSRRRRGIEGDPRYPYFSPLCTVYSRDHETTLISLDDGRRAMIKVGGRIQILDAVSMHPQRRRSREPQQGPFSSSDNFPVLRGDSYETVYQGRGMTLRLINTYRHPLRRSLDGCSHNNSARLTTQAILKVGGQTQLSGPMPTACRALCEY